MSAPVVIRMHSLMKLASRDFLGGYEPDATLDGLSGVKGLAVGFIRKGTVTDSECCASQGLECVLP